MRRFRSFVAPAAAGTSSAQAGRSGFFLAKSSGVNSVPPADLVRTLHTASPEAVVARPRELLR